MGANAVRAMPTAGTAREAIRRDARGAKATPVSRAQRQIATAFNPSNVGGEGRGASLRTAPPPCSEIQQ